MKNFKLLLLAILVVCTVCVLTVVASAATVVDEGYVMQYVTYDADNSDNNVENTDGSTNDVRWTLTDDGVLTISSTNSSEMKMNPGAGYSSAYNYKARIPWYTEHASEIYSVVVESSITYLNGACMLGYLPNCTSITFEASSVKLNGSMLFTNLEKLTSLKFAGVDYSAYEGKNVIDLRYFTGSSSQGFESTCKNLEVTVLSPYLTNMPFGTACLFTSSTKANFVVLEGSPAYKFAATDYPAATYRIYMPASNLSYESYTSAIIEGVSTDGYAAWDFDAVSGLLTINKTDKEGSWKQFNSKGTYATFKNAYGSYIKNIVFNGGYNKIYMGETYGVFSNLTNLETVKLPAGQRIQNDTDCGMFEGCTALKAVSFGGELVDGVADLSGATDINTDDVKKYSYLRAMFSGCEAIEKVILPSHTNAATICADTFAGCTALTTLDIPETITTIEEGAFDAWINSTEGYSALTVTFPLDSTLADSFASAGLLTVIAPKTEIVASGWVDQSENGDNDLWWEYDSGTKTLTLSGTATSVIWKDGATSGWDSNYGTNGGTNVSMIPWYADYASEIETVIITAPITTTPAAIFYKNHALKSVTFPAETVSLGNMAFADCKALVELKTAGADSPDNVIDLRNFTGTVKNQVFETAPANGATLWLPRTGNFDLNNVFGRTGNSYNFVVYPGSVGETSVYNMINSRATRVYGTFDYTYYTEEQAPEWYAEYMATISCANDAGTTSHTFDIATGKITVKSSGWDTYMNYSGFVTMVNTWKYAIKTVYVANSPKYTAQTQSALLSNLPELEAIVWNGNRAQNAPIFKNNPKLTTFGTSSNVVRGVVNLSAVQELDNLHNHSKLYASMFEGNKSITKIILPEMGSKYGVISIGANAFKDCTGLRSIVIPANCGLLSTQEKCNEGTASHTGSYTGTIDSTAFAGLTEPVVIYNEMADDTLAQALLAVLPKGSKIYTETPSTGDGLTSSVVFDGWKVRTSGYNGLRGVFYADNAKIDANEENGWTLVELGALLSTTKSKNANGVRVYYDETNGVTKDSHVRIYPTLRGGNTEDNIVGKTLTGADVITDNTYFAVSVVKYAANYTVEVYMAGYEVWKDTSGNVVIMYTDYATDKDHDANLQDASIYEVSMRMYMEGFINDKNDPDDIVWDTMVAGGALVLTEGTHYDLTNDKIEGDITDLNGNAFGSTFTFVNVPAVNTSANKTEMSLEFSDSGTTLSIFAHPTASGKYVLVYGSNGNSATVGVSPYGTPYYLSQVSTKWFGSATTVSGKLPNPLLKTNIWGSIDHVVFDKGIKSVSGSSFHGCGATTYVYSEDLVKVDGTAFQSANNLTTMYKAGTKDVVTGRVDLHTMNSVGASYTFNACTKFVELWLPENVTIGQEFAQSATFKTLWLGDISNRRENVINLANATKLTSIGGKAFTATKATTVMLPASVTAISDTAFTATALEIRQAAKVDAIETYCAGKGYTYVDLNGDAFVALEESEGWSGIIVK